MTSRGSRAAEPRRWPRPWFGTWVATDFKTVSIGWNGDEITITVRPSPCHAPYRSAELLDGSTRQIDHLPARCRFDDQGRRYLEAEAGTSGLGPTYRLY